MTATGSLLTRRARLEFTLTPVGEAGRSPIVIQAQHRIPEYFRP